MAALSTSQMINSLNILNRSGRCAFKSFVLKVCNDSLCGGFIGGVLWWTVCVSVGRDPKLGGSRNVVRGVDLYVNN